MLFGVNKSIAAAVLALRAVAAVNGESAGNVPPLNGTIHTPPGTPHYDVTTSSELWSLVLDGRGVLKKRDMAPETSPETNDAEKCGVLSQVWNHFGFYEEHPWLWYSAGVAVFVPVAFYVAEYCSDRVVNMVANHYKIIEMHNVWAAKAEAAKVVANNGAVGGTCLTCGNIKREESEVITFDAKGYVTPEGYLEGSDLGMSTRYAFNYTSGSLEQRGFTQSVTAPIGEKRSSGLTFVYAVDGHAISYGQQNHEDLKDMLTDMFNGVWSNGGEACFNQQIFGVDAQMHLQVSTYNGYDQRDLWGSCCGIDRQAPWRDLGWSAYDSHSQ